MKATTALVFVLATLLAANAQDFDIQGHRGCRGLMPENSLPGFLKAIDIGVTTIELDVVVSADGKVVVSHDHYFSSKFCLNELGMPISSKKEKDISIYWMDYEDVVMFDCGSIGNPDFPEQQKMKVEKPLLCDVIKRCEAYAAEAGKEAVKYNIELKSSRSGDNSRHPEPELFTRLVYEGIKDLVPKERVIIQSFDPRILQFWKMKYEGYQLSYLLSGVKSPDKVIEILGFTPEIFSPYYKTLSKKAVEEWHDLSVSVIPWTVNDPSDMKKMISMGVDGLITDYPNRYFESFAKE